MSDILRRDTPCYIMWEFSPSLSLVFLCMPNQDNVDLENKLRLMWLRDPNDTTAPDICGNHNIHCHRQRDSPAEEPKPRPVARYFPSAASVTYQTGI